MKTVRPDPGRDRQSHLDFAHPVLSARSAPGRPDDFDSSITNGLCHHQGLVGVDRHHDVEIPRRQRPQFSTRGDGQNFGAGQDISRSFVATRIRSIRSPEASSPPTACSASTGMLMDRKPAGPDGSRKSVDPDEHALIDRMSCDLADQGRRPAAHGIERGDTRHRRRRLRQHADGSTRADRPAGRSDRRHHHGPGLVVIAQHNEVGGERQDRGKNHQEVGGRNARQRVTPADPTGTHRSSLAHLITYHPASLLPPPRDNWRRPYGPVLSRCTRTRKK